MITYRVITMLARARACQLRRDEYGQADEPGRIIGVPAFRQALLGNDGTAGFRFGWRDR